VNLSGVTNIAGYGTGGVNFYADYQNSVINLLGMLSFNGPGTLSQANGGLILINTNTVYQNVSLQLAPAILTQPQGLTASFASNATFSVLVNGSQPLSYQWFFNQATLLSGATNATLGLPSASYGEPAGNYTVVVTNLYGSITSAPALLTLNGTTVTTANLNSTWTTANSPYIVNTNIVATNLTIQPGVTILINGPYSLTVTGFLQAAGTSINPISFMPTSQATGWNGVELSSGSVGNMTNCILTGCINHAVQVDTNATLILQGCIFTNNILALGGGGPPSGGPALYNYGSVFAYDSVFSYNLLYPPSVGNGWGGAVYSSGIFMAERCCFANNKISGYGGDSNGPSARGGALCQAGGTGILDDCIFDSNGLIHNSGDWGALGYGGGAIYINSGTLAAIRCRFTGNYNYGEGMSGAVILNDATNYLTNCIFAFNNAGSSSIGVIEGGSGEVMNCTIVNNSVIGVNNFVGDVHNSVIYNNTPAQVNGSPNLFYSDIQGGAVGIGNINADPLFLDVTNFLLADNSPAIDAGDPNPIYNDVYFPPSQGGLRNDMGAYGGSDSQLAYSFGAPQVFYNGTSTPPLALPNTNTIQISIQTSFTNGYIFYSLDGSDPTVGTFYSGPFYATVPANLQAIAFDSDFINSATIAPVDLAYLPLTVFVPGGGTVTNYLPSGPYLINSSVTLTATTNSGWSFMNWAGDSTSTNPVVVITMTSNKSVQAVFGTSISTSTSGGGSIVLNPAVGSYAYGSVVRCTPVPNAGKYLAFWGGAASGGSGNPLNFIVTNANPTISAIFATLPANKYSLAVLTSGSGTVTNNPFTANYASNSTVTLTAVPDTGNYFVNWSGNASGSMNPLNFTMNTNMVITATFSTAMPLTNQPPTIAITNPIAGAIFTAPVNISINASASDPDGSVTQVVFFNGANQLGTKTNSPYNFIWINLPVGTNVLTAVATDNGGLSTTSAQVSIVVQPSVPQVALISPTNNNSFLTNASILVSAIASDADNALAQVELFAQSATNNAQPFLLSTITNPPYNFTWSGMVTGAYTLTALAIDSYGLIVTSAPVNIAVTVPPSTNPPVFLFSSANYSVNESNGAVVLTVLNNGNLGGLVNYSTADGTAYGGSGFSGSYMIAQGSLLFANGQSSTNITIGILDNYLDGPDIHFSVQLFNPSTGSLGTPAATTVTIHQNDVGGATNSLLTTVSPSAQPVTSGALTMVLTPTNAAGQWRFPWEQGWHQSGDTELGLQAGNYPVEFQDVSNYLDYPTTVTIAVTNNGTTVVTNQYLPTYTSLDTNSTGSLTVNIGPNTPSGSGWRFIGESTWRSPNTGAFWLLPDTYFIQYETVSGWSSPDSQAAVVFGGQATIVSVNYQLAASLPGGVSTPSQIVPSLITDIRDYPYGFNGQLYTDVGYGSGVAVRESVVLTAAHMVFNDATLSYVNQAYWSFQQETGTFSPEPLAARGWYVLSGYAAQRTNDLQVGGYGIDQSSPQSREMDVAALYFLSTAARGGYGGYLASDVSPNPWLTGSNLKMLVGYPVDGSEYGQTVQSGTMYAVTPQPATLTLVSNDVYSASWFLSYPGNSGGPVYVQYNGYYYPAAVYLGALGSGANSVSVVRAINSDVVNLINLAASEGDAGTNYTGGGVITLIAGSATLSNPAYIQVLLSPAAAVQAGAGWELQGDGIYGSAANYTRIVTSTRATVAFKPVAGWNTPTNQAVQLTAGAINVINASYTVVPPILTADNIHGIGLTGTAGTSYLLQYRTNLTSGSWLTLKTNTLGAGLNTVLPWPPTNGPAAFYRALWLGQ
jgi:hypothetical protein